MTREEAINILNYEIDKMSDNRGSDYSGVIALGMAIQALKQEPCTDAISRQAVDDILCLYSDKNGMIDARGAVRMVRELPSVNPQEPKYCDRNICLKNDYNNIGCAECEVTKSKEPIFYPQVEGITPTVVKPQESEEI